MLAQLKDKHFLHFDNFATTIQQNVLFKVERITAGYVCGTWVVGMRNETPLFVPEIWDCFHAPVTSGTRLNIKTARPIPGMGIPMLKIRRSRETVLSLTWGSLY